MSIPVIVWEWINNGFYHVMWFLIMNSTHRSRFGKGLTWLLEMTAFVAVIWVTFQLPHMSVFRSLLLPVTECLLFFWLFRDSKIKVLFTYVVLVLVLMGSELLGVLTYFPPEALAGTPELLSEKGKLLYYGIYMLCNAGLYGMLYLFLNRVKYSMALRDCLFLILFPISQYMLLFGWLEMLRWTDDEGLLAYFVFMAGVCVAADVLLFLAVRRIAQRAQLAAENEQLESQLSAQEKHYADLTAQYENIRRMRHDIANHLNVMQSLLESGRSGEAAAYVSELTEQPFDATLGLCEHPVVDAFLHSKITAAKAAGIGVECRVSLAAWIPISSVDLIRAFGNLLDNAVEACSGIPDAVVKLKCAQSQGFLVIITENPVPSVPEAKAQRIPGLERGVGTRVLTALAEKYDGRLKQEQSSGLHKTELILKIEGGNGDTDRNL